MGGMKQLALLDEPSFSTLLSELKALESGTEPGTVKREVKVLGLESAQIGQLLDSVYSLYGLLDRSELSVSDVCEEITETVASSKEFDEVDADAKRKLPDRLHELLNLGGVLMIGSKAMGLMADDLESRFRALADQWRRETGALSVTTKKITHPAYYQIITLGPRVIPFILKELNTRPAHWFTALEALTGIDPVLPQNQGRYGLMQQDWLNYGRTHHLI